MKVDNQVISSDSVADLNSRLTWLQQDDDLSGAVRALTSPPRPGDMGTGVTEVLIVTVTSAAAMQALARCAISWIQHRGTRIEVKLAAPDGRKIEIDGSDVRRISSAKIQELVRGANRMLQGEDG